MQVGGLVGSALGVFGMGSPDAPDPYAMAGAQSKYSKEALYDSAAINQMGINMPGYNISYSGDIGDPNRQMNYNLSPEQQQLSQMLSGSAAGIAGAGGFNPDYSGVSNIPQAGQYTPFSSAYAAQQPGQQMPTPGYAGGPAIPTAGQYTPFDSQYGAGGVSMPGSGDYSAQGQAIDDQTYEALMNRIQPEQQREYDRSLTSLNVSGNPMGSEGYGWEMDRLSDRQFDQNMQAALTANQAGRAEQGRLFGQDFTRHQQDQANMARLFGQDVTGYQQNLVGQGQEFGQQMAGRQQGVGEQGQYFGQGMAGRQQGMAEQGQYYGQDLAGYQQNLAAQNALFGQGLAANQQGMANVGTQAQMPLSQMAQLMSLDPATQQQAPGMPSYSLAPPDIAGYMMNNYNISAGSNNSMLGGLAGLGGAAMMAPVGTFT